MNRLASQGQFPLLSGQKRLWLMYQQDSANPAYNIQLNYHLKGSVNYDTFKDSIRLLFNHQRAIFSVFRQREGAPFIEIIPRDIELELIDFSHLLSETRKDRILSFAGEESRKPFDIENGPLYRLFLLKEDDGNYVFHATIHHLIFDGWSRRIFVQELSRIYTSLLHGSCEMPEAIKYHSYDFAAFEARDGLDMDEKPLSEFWKENLKDCPTELKFPYDYSRKDSLSGLGCREPLFVSESLTNRLKELSANENSSLFKTMLSVIGVLLNKYTGENDICIGFPVSNRRVYPAMEDVFGFFVNTSVARLKIGVDKNFRQHINYTKDVAKKAIENSKLSFDKIIQAVNPERRPGLNPLFQVSLTWLTNDTIPMNLDGDICERINVQKGVSPFDIGFYLWETDDHIEGEIEYSTDLLKPDTIVRLKNNFLNLVTAIVKNPDISIRSLSMISDEETTIIDDWNNTQTDYPKSKTIVQLFEEQADQYPDKVAVVYKDERLTYRQLNERTNQLARYLRKLGVKRETHVGLYVEKSMEMIVGTLGILKAGGAYLPIDPDYPAQRVEFIIRESECRILLTQSGYMETRIDGAKKVDINSPDIFDEERGDVENVNSSSDLAYIMYTSGTTGVPKGSSIQQQSVVRLVCNTNYIELLPMDRILLTGAIVFDATTFEIWGALLNGGTLYVVGKETILDPEALGEELIRNDITILWLTSALFTQIAEARTDIFRKLKYLLVGGDVLSTSHINKVRKDNASLKVINGYGPTENTTFSTTFLIDRNYDNNIPIGKPISNSTAYIFDANMNYQPIGILGELYVGGDGLSRGYINRDDLNRTCFKEHPDKPGERLYKTGDYARWLPDGNIEFHGRIDSQIKIRGYRIEMGEVESGILEFPMIKNCAVKPTGARTSNAQLIGYIVPKSKTETIVNDLKAFLLKKLPAYMIPAHFVLLDEMPMTSGGKIDRKALPEPEIIVSEIQNEPVNAIEEKLIGVWKKVLNVDTVGLYANFFETGGTSILIPGILEGVKKSCGIALRSVNIFEYPTIKSLAEFISLSGIDNHIVETKGGSGEATFEYGKGKRDIAVIGMGGCFPGADNASRFWEVIKKGEVAISHFSREELKGKGVPDELLDNPDYVYAKGTINRADLFDSGFFDIASREADFMDPQHRLFLEVCYEAIEDSGYAPRTMPRNIGVFAGAGKNDYLLKSLMKHPDDLRSVGEFQNRINNGKDFLTTRVSYKLNFTGPSFDVQTACSTSLVAIHTACQSLLNNECDMALGGGVSLQIPNGNGYMYRQGSILSPTGHCRPFDERADGTIVGEGAAVVLLKRLDDAIRDKDHIYAVIKSTAINNDGAVKVGYMAPGLEGQARVIKQAMELAEVAPETITFVETHGTGTKLGDPIEIAALRKAFNTKGKKNAHCALGAVKANIGHLDAASGAAGFIKAVLALKNKQIPPLAGFTGFNKEIDMEGSPFYAPTVLKEWKTDKMPRRAAVSSFGIGGTNAHCIIEEWAPAESNNSEVNRYHLFPVSAKTQASLEMMNEKYLSFFETSDLNISDIAYTMQNGRESFKYRQVFVASDIKDKSALLICKGVQLFEKPRTAFMFTGQGSQYLTMSRGLYETFPTFKKYIDASHKILKTESGIDLIELLFSSNGKYSINDTIYAQPALVAVQYASARLLEEFGIKPDVLIGHSIGEITAACLSGVFSFNDMLLMAARRGELMQRQEKGSMLSVNLPEKELKKILIPGVEISLLNAPEFCVVSGTSNDINDFREKLAVNYPGLQTTVLKTSHAFHSYLMEPALTPFRLQAEKMTFNKVNIPFISNTSGILIKNEEAASSKYWSDHIRKPVNFEAGIRTLLEQQTLFLEVGPGSMLTSLLSQFNSDKGFKAIPTMRGAKQEADDTRYFLNAIAQYWIAGGNINWAMLYKTPRNRVSVPTYSFNRKRHWVDTKSVFSFDYSSDDNPGETYLESASEPNCEEARDRGGFTEVYVKPESEIQKTLVKIWESYLGIKGIGLADDFFTLGGHSLLASQVINKVNEHFKVNLPIETLFKTPVIEKLERKIEEAKKRSSLSFDLPKVKRSEFLPVSNEQIRLWMVTQMDNNPAYNIPFTFKFTGNLNEEIFSRSIDQVFNRHSILRGRIVTVDIDPALVIDSEGRVNIQHIDLSEIPEPEKGRRVERFISDDIRKLFDIENDPLYRLYLIKTAENEIVFHMTIHHIIFDGWSWGIFVRDLKKAYTELSEDKNSVFTDDANQYYEFAQWQKDYAFDQQYDKSIIYWKEVLNGHNGTLHFPYDFPRKEIKSGLGSKESFTVDKDVRVKLKTLAKELNVTDFVIYISVFSILLNKYSKDDDFCIGIPSANRLSYQMEGIIGFFVNTLVLRFRLDKNLEFTDYINETKKTIIGAFEHQELPFEKLVEAIQPERTVNSNPIFQVLFAWLNTPSEIFEFPNVKTERCSIKDGVSHLDMTFYIWDRDICLDGEVEYSIDVLSAETIRLVISDYLKLLKNIAGNPGTAIENL